MVRGGAGQLVHHASGGGPRPADLGGRDLHLPQEPRPVLGQLERLSRCSTLLRPHQVRRLDDEGDDDTTVDDVRADQLYRLGRLIRRPRPNTSIHDRREHAWEQGEHYVRGQQHHHVKDCYAVGH